MLVSALPSSSWDSVYVLGKSVHFQNVVYTNEIPNSCHIFVSLALLRNLMMLKIQKTEKERERGYSHLKGRL